MLKVFLVDDEYYERLSLKNSLPWEEHGLVVSGEANNGQTALEMMMADPPDIAIVDINMPKLNGLELISRLCENQLECRYIILTGYDEFKYAQQAIRLGVSDYILKPINYQNLCSALDELSREIQQEDTLNSHMKSLENENERFILEGYYNDLVNCNFSVQNIDQYDHKLADRLLPGYQSYIAALFEPASILPKEKLRLLLDNIRKSIGREGYICCLDTKSRLFFIFDGNAQNVFPQRVCQVLAAAEKEGVTLSAGIGDICRGPEDLYLSYHEACIALQNCSVLKQRAIQYQNLKSAAAPATMDAKQKNQLKSMITAKDTDNLEVLLTSIYQKMEDEKALWDNILLQTLSLLNLLTESLSAQSSSPISVTGGHGSILDTLNNMKSLDAIRDWIILIYKNSVTSISGNDEYSDVTICVENYILRHYGNPELTITDIANALYLNYSYICYCFKRDKQMTINDFLNKVRIEKAISLFQDHVENVSYVAEKTGFGSASYFSKQFKKATGLPPSEYLKTI